MRGEIRGVDEEFLHTYFDSTQVLLNDSELLREVSLLGLVIEAILSIQRCTKSLFDVTHAPCKNKYIGKLDTNSILEST